MTQNGFDVSSNNRSAGHFIDLSAVAADFVMIKATEGTTYVNPVMEAHIRQAQGSGKQIGLYHYMRMAAPASEAAYFLRAVRPYLGQVVLALDIEDGPLLSDLGPTRGLGFLQAVAAATGIRPLVYTNLSEEGTRNWAPVVAGGYGLWIAQYNNGTVSGYQPRALPQPLKHWPRYEMFQYTSTGRLAGWPENLDLNVFMGTARDWAALATGQAPVLVGLIAPIQQWLNQAYQANLAVDNVAGLMTRRAVVRGVQTELNRQFGRQLVVDGLFGPLTKAAMRNIALGAVGPLTQLIQSALIIRGATLILDGRFGFATAAAVRQFQAAQGLVVDGIVGPATAARLFGW
ncbi:GH25 family lysozyme [Lacticaseibacillus daqingensis]|uniref:GH25 family lysozyme n=1 Tax=Lacticaseibacillus daqingensis TaxID=2486014 RepID=UPI000F7B5A7C|nr:GH25 family lysozyme [Lacticaseibacillus daqingensis]